MSSPTSQYSQERVSHHPRGAVYPSVPTQSLDVVVDRTLSRAVGYERQLKEVESRLSEHLGNYRAIDGLLQEAITILRRNTARARKAETDYVPRMTAQLDSSLSLLSSLSSQLPTIRTQTLQVRAAYDAGRRKAQALVADLEWLNRDWYDRWRAAVFARDAPVSWRWRALMRALFAACVLVFLWGAWTAVRGAYRAHRHRLVWGERVLS
ncbi:hypothetical protein GLOTRDRAFT_128289 [Gloeophyllum trabeum ATCC 11539]|uniref:Uncharacterized protein n=1 Tax=Gloeophyllum trabeum (strain ATCC 11539 / FP-39264 / Madison 617) TaxID=670483 RepID=S7RT90_GLOTA|nr:uncharacterized protein GLOTRDRAFT_128289 [Gloeophyllum trabeum ATCC 11539]EPQ56344.1 hypothetical protein GLOTRDRAFT_128289 [Gloeophyllum trabeum ATCC 11539]